MGQYTRTPLTTLTTAALNTELAAIETAHNSHSTGDFPSNCVPVTALANDKADFIIPLQHNSAVGANKDYTNVLAEGFGYTPMACTLVAVTAIAGSVTVAAGNTNVKVYYDGAATTNAMALSGDGVGAIDSSPPTTSLSAQKKLEIRADNGAGDDASGIQVYLHCKKQLNT